MEDTRIELDRLRGQLQRQRRALLVVAIAAAGAIVSPLRAAAPPGTIDAQRFRLVDAAGNVRGNLMMVGDNAALGLLDSAGKVRALLNIGEEIGLALSNETHQVMIVPSGISFDAAGRRQVALGTGPQAMLMFNDESGKPAAVLNRQTLLFNTPAASLSVGILNGRTGILAKDATGAERILDLATGAAKPLDQ